MSSTQANPQPADDPVQTTLDQMDDALTPEEVVEDTSVAGDLILGKFKTAEDLANAYTELEKKLGSSEPPEDTETPAEDAETSLEIPEEAREATEEAGVNIDAYYEAYANQDGQLTDEQYAELETKGFPRNLVDNYIRGQEALRVTYEKEIMSTAGSDQDYVAMTSWAQEHLSEAETRAFNNAVGSMDEAQAKLAVQGLKARYEAANGQTPSRTVEGGPATSKMFADEASWLEAVADPRYSTSPAYRAEVDARLENSMIAGIIS